MILDIMDDKDLEPGLAAKGRDGGSWRRPIWKDEGDAGTIVAVWKAEPGVYDYPARPIEETFVVFEGEAICTLGSAAAVRLKPGSIVRVPKGSPISLEVLTPFRKLATVVPKP
ncbi:cupin domain-containing protein [Mesorhizobium sp. SB112]|uniref:cupin domain-containing protein n=1 Tax=Mesorhizobium sp. SB112 TaxID=3151853 RepID=UPI003267E9FC